jgi:hypothetical protein
MLLQALVNFLSNPVVDIIVHLMIAGVFVMELISHWSHHRKQKRKRGEPTYTLDEARVILFEEALNVGNVYHTTV